LACRVAADFPAAGSQPIFQPQGRSRFSNRFSKHPKHPEKIEQRFALDADKPKEIRD
jgi:hypothetical protein